MVILLYQSVKGSALPLLHFKYKTKTIDVNSKYDTRVARLTATYNFGNTKVKARQHKSGADDEAERVKSN